jgi:hypothetical protein
VILIGVAAFIGTIRFGFGLVDQLKTAHELASRVAGLISSVLLLVSVTPRIGIVVTPLATALGVVIILVLAFLVPIAGPLINLVGILAGAAILIIPKGEPIRRVVTFVAFALLLASVTALPTISDLNPTIKWHVYHTTLALWVALLPFCMKRRDRVT